MTPSFETTYPNIAYFTDALGYIEIGCDGDSPLTSFLRAFDEGGMVWEGEDSYPTLDDAFRDMEQGLGEWMEEMGIEAEQ